MIGRILVPLDGSTFAESSLPTAVALARRAGAEIDLLTVHEPIPSFAYDEWETAAEAWAERYLADVVDRLGEGAPRPVHTAVRSGRVAEEIQRRADTHGADLVVMATHGRGAFTRAWLGSVADAYVRHATTPVLLVRPRKEDTFDVTDDWAPSTVLVSLDGSSLSETILGHARTMAELFDARLLLVRIVEYPVEIASPYLPHTVQMNAEVVQEARRSALDYLEKHAAGLREDGITVDAEARVDSQAGRGILHVADEEDVDLVCMSTHGRGGVTRAILGSAVDKVIRGGQRPVLVVRADEE